MKNQIDDSILEEALAATEPDNESGKVYGEHFTLPPVTANRLLTGIDQFGGASDQQADKFLQQNRAEYEKFQAHETLLLHVGSQYHALAIGLQDQKAQWSGISQAIEAELAADVPAQLFTALKLGVNPTQAAIAANLLASFILRQNGKQLLKLIEGHIKELEQRLETFKRDNAEVLRELKLI